jgi:hypothetical protein
MVTSLSPFHRWIVCRFAKQSPELILFVKSPPNIPKRTANIRLTARDKNGTSENQGGKVPQFGGSCADCAAQIFLSAW